MTPERRERVMRLHSQAPVIDTHSDSLRATLVGDPQYNPFKDGPPRPRRMWEKGESGHWDFPRALEAGLTGQVANLLVPRHQHGPFVHTLLKAYQQAVADLEAAPHLALIARTTADIEQAHREGKIALILAIEGAEGLEGDLDMIHVFHRLGVRLIGLTWMYKNEVAEGNWEDTGAGLSTFGREVVREMNKLKMVVDVAHATEQTFWDTLSESTAPVICSHTSCRALVKSYGKHAPSRYLTDEQIKALVAQQGMLGIFFAANRELEKSDADVHDLARFFVHAAELVGPEHVGFGSDFDGISPPAGLEDVRGLPTLTSALIDAGFSDRELLGILGGNWLRVLRSIWGK